MAMLGLRPRLVDNVENTFGRFRTLGAAFNKKPDDGEMSSIASILDHDGCVESRVVPCILALTVCLIMQVLGVEMLLLRAIHVFPVLKVAISVRSMVVLKLTLKFGLVGGCGA
jgi:hypothetical protein